MCFIESALATLEIKCFNISAAFIPLNNSFLSLFQQEEIFVFLYCLLEAEGGGVGSICFTVAQKYVYSPALCHLYVTNTTSLDGYAHVRYCKVSLCGVRSLIFFLSV